LCLDSAGALGTDPLTSHTLSYLKRGQFKTRHRTTVITGGGIAVGTDPPRSLTLSYVKRSPLKTGPHITVTTRIVSSGNILKKITEA